MIGFVDLGEINNYLAFEQSLEKDDPCVSEKLANSMYAIMVNGLFTPLHFAYANFPWRSTFPAILGSRVST